MSTTYMVYYTNPIDNLSYGQNTHSLTEALALSEAFRKNGMRFVTMASENSDFVGSTGAVVVENGKLPSGEVYEYTKKDALSQRSRRPPAVGTDSIVVNIDDE